MSREVPRNKSEGGLYLPDRAQQQMSERRSQSKQKFSSQSEECIAEIKTGLKQYHSPEQIAGRFKRTGRSSISHETIYQMIYANHQGMKGYQQYLRQGRGKRRKRGGVTQRGGRFQDESELNIAPALQMLKPSGDIGKVTR